MKGETLQIHPMAPFLPEGARLLLLGSFPPPPARWSMDFFYPNFQNDMWRIMGLVFYNNPEVFVQGKAFSKDLIQSFCTNKGLALYDTAIKVIRSAGNASDKYLEVIEPVDFAWLLDRLPLCGSVAATGQKAAATLLQVIAGDGFGQQLTLPRLGEYVLFHYRGKAVRLYRMPSSSRAYPMSLERKTFYYKKMFTELL
ncbi:MAG: uracil-DNA glycosylase family protein [Bacteroidales bacterium]|jgi:G:T/U-mismatch repair DNA glycosylase|nr:uracil-DNA glycosylase family protein [Bacteroidales bacterium]MDD2264609.1 uracil-DNA glycosylase family protein [Bacteroidales bacterium]MDD3208995.1 uracil-DNA glycosylase family protein [Bacteroidales bacterium]MDD3697829.1 uracil-DNA glycosylase family protein [Bacteroidales bacterium]MDD4168158.1 uracil-DNA glycosylase family protein [Bacteroidales bacterium]